MMCRIQATTRLAVSCVGLPSSPCEAVREAGRLGLQFDFTLGSGWPYGVPFIPLELAARRLRLVHQEVDGPRHVSFEFLSGEIVDGDRFVCAVAAPVLSSGEPDLAHAQVL